MKMDYTHYDEDKQTSKDMNANEKAKAMAREMVGDGQSPNLWFVSHGPFVLAPGTEDDCWDFELMEGFDIEKDTFTQGPFASYEEALECYDEIQLDEYYGVGQVFIEDRQCGTVTEKWLVKKTKIVYEADERDDSKGFYNK
jgi:hypothetical protein